MAIQKDWKISRRHSKCTHSGEKFADEETFYTCIFDDPEGEGFLRKDFSVASWEELSKTLEPFSFWKTTCKYPQEDTTPEALGNESAETMLRRMIDEDEASTENARYILALMLERKKTLVPVGVKETELSRLLLYEHRASGDVLVIRDPQLRLDEVEKIQKEVSDLLDQDKVRNNEVSASDDQTDDANKLNTGGKEDKTEGATDINSENNSSQEVNNDQSDENQAVDETVENKKPA